VGELDAALAARGQPWPGRETFLARALPRHQAIGDTEQAVLIDGSVLANAPFRPAIDALKSRPARRELDRRFVYIDPKPGTVRSGSTPRERRRRRAFCHVVRRALRHPARAADPRQS
jgi:hypothetical protein